MSYLYELEGIYAQLQAMELDDETFNDTLESIDFEKDLERNIEYFVKLWKNAVSDAERFKQAKQEFYEIILDYDTQSLLKQTIVRFNVVDYAYKGDIFKTPPLRMVFDANNRLLPAYKSYELTDYRK